MPLPPLPRTSSRRFLIGDPPQTGFVIAIALLYLFTGLFGRDPWKGEDALHIGIALAFVREGDWLLPRLAGQAWLEGPPLYHWIAAIIGQIAAWTGASFADGARLASALFAALWLWGSAGAARELYGPSAARIAPLLALANIGVVVHLHDAQPATSLLAALGLGMWALALIARKPWHGGGALVLALAIAGLGTGLWLAVILLAAAGVMPLLPVWRNVASPPSRRVALPLSMALGALLAGSWLLLLDATHPALAAHIYREDIAHLQPDGALFIENSLAWIKILAWFAWPALPLAGWALWKRRHQWQSPVLTLPLLILVLLFVQITGDSLVRNQRALPLLAPLVVLGSAGLPALRRGAANALDWFGVMTFSLLGCVIWMGWVAMLTGWPERFARTFSKLEPGFVMTLSWLPLILAATLSLAWFWMLWRSPRTPTRGAVTWGCGMLLIWFLLSSLWLPWIDYGRSYRDVADQMADALPKQTGCIAFSGLQDSQRAAFYYFAGIKPVNALSRAGMQCDTLLAYHGRGGKPPALDARWSMVWEGRRPGDRHERFMLYKRD
jgi:4-amino-4-deoxy-L-arabinose transferase-like glycosyltransferase